MEQETFEKIIESWRRAERESTPAAPTGKTEHCLSFGQLQNYAEGRYASDEQKIHVEACGYCQRMVRLFKEQAKTNVFSMLANTIMERLSEFISFTSSAFERITTSVGTPLWKFIHGLSKLAILMPRPIPIREIIAILFGIAGVVLIVVLVTPPSKKEQETISERKVEVTKKYSVFAKIEPVHFVPLVIRGPEQRTESERLFDEGMKFYSGKKYAEAIQRLQTAADKNPKSVDAQFYLGLCYLLTDSTDKAIEHFRQAVALGGNSVLEKSHWYLGNAYLLKEDGAKALEEFEKVVKLEGDYEWQARERITEIENVN